MATSMYQTKQKHKKSTHEMLNEKRMLFVYQTTDLFNKLPSYNFLKSIDTLDYLYFPQTYFTNHGKSDKKKISFVGKYENFSNDLNFVFKKLNINNI